MEIYIYSTGDSTLVVQVQCYVKVKLMEMAKKAPQH